MPGLSGGDTGLALGDGLIWLEDGIGGPGFTNPDAPSVTATMWQTFEGALNAAGLAANDNDPSLGAGAWSVVNVEANLSVGASAEFGTGRLINDIPDTGVQGLVFDCANGATGDNGGYVQVNFTGVNVCSAGFWINVPAAITGTFTTHAVARIQDATDDRQMLVHVINNGATTIVQAYVWQQGGSAGVTISPGTWYWVTMGFTRNVTPDGWKLRVYDIDGVQVGVEQTRISGNTPQIAMIIGNFGSGGEVDGDFLLDDLVMDLDTGVFPLGPPLAA